MAYGKAGRMLKRLGRKVGIIKSAKKAPPSMMKRVGRGAGKAAVTGVGLTSMAAKKAGKIISKYPKSSAVAIGYGGYKVGKGRKAKPGSKAFK